MSKYCSPFAVIPMPVDKDGRGPEMDPTKVVKVLWQVWDGAYQTVSSHDSEEEADKAARKKTEEETEEEYE